eukprot:gene26246-32791_t
MSWSAAHTLDLLQPLVTVLRHHKRTAESFKTLLNAPVFEHDDLMAPVQMFVSSLVDYVPQVKNDATGKLFKSIRRLLTSDKCIRLFGLLCHFCYWNTIHPAARATVRLLRDTNPTIFETADLTAQFEDRVNMSDVLMGNPSSQPSRIDLLQAHLRRIHANEGGAGSNAPFPLNGEEEAHPLGSIDELFLQEMSKQGGDDSDLQLQQRRGHSAGLAIVAEDTFSDKEDDEEKDVRQYDKNSKPVESVKLNPRELQSICSVATEASLSAFEKEQLFMQLESCLISVFSKSGTKIAALVSSRQALISCAHFVVDDIFTTEYPWFSSLSDKSKEDEEEEEPTDDKTKGAMRKMNKPPANTKPIQDPALTTSIRELNLRLRRLAHRSLSDIIDPSRLYTSSMLLTALVGNEAKFLTTNLMGRAKYYGTSVAIKAVLGDTTSYKARKFFQRADKLQTSLPGVVDPYADPDPVERLAKETVNQHYSLEQQIASEQFAGPQSFRRTRSPLAVNTSRRAGGTFSGESRDGDKHSPLHGFERTSSWDKIPSSPEHKHRSARQLDFNNLFANQPDADYFPNPADRQAAEVAAVAAAVVNPFGSFAQPSFGVSFAAITSVKESPRQKVASPVVEVNMQSLNKTNKLQVDSDVMLINAILDKQSAQGGAATRKTSRFQKIQTTMNSNHYVNPPSDTPLFANQGMRTQHQQQFDQQLDQQFQQQSYFHQSSSASVGSVSFVSADNRSIAYNKNAKMHLSLSAKSSLMTLVTNKAAHTYAAQPKTNHTLNRVALIQSGAHKDSR